MMDLKEYKVKDFAEMVKVELETISDLMEKCYHMSYTNTPYENIKKEVQKTNIDESKQEIIIKYIHTNIYNNSEHRFYNGHGYTHVYSTPGGIF